MVASALKYALLFSFGLASLGSARLFRGPTPQLPYDPNTSPHCSWWLDYDGTETCQEILDWNWVTLADFVRWNPSLSPTCGGLTAGRSYCVEAYNEPPPVTTTTTGLTTTRTTSTTTSTSTSTRSPTTTTSTTTTTTPGNGIETPQPTQPGMVSNCDRFYFVREGDSCAAIAIQHGVTQQNLIQWNPSVGSTCGGIWANVYVCVRTIGFQPPTTTTTRPPTTTTAGNGIQTPQPTQPGMVSNCDRFYFVREGDSCAAIATQHGVTQQNLIQWNPTVGSTCSGIWANVYLCVRTIGFTPTTTTTTTRTTTTTPGNGISTPTPTQPGMVSNCDRFYFVRDGDNCASIGARHGIRADRISQWHTSVGTNCAGLWANANVCVRTIGFQPQTQMSCGAGNGKAWGTNKPAALNSVVLWCNGDSSTDGSGGFATAQRKTGCYNAPNGDNRIQFQARNDFGSGASLSVAKCNEIMRLAIDRCDNGGTGTQEGWWFSAVVVAGRC